MRLALAAPSQEALSNTVTGRPPTPATPADSTWIGVKSSSPGMVWKQPGLPDPKGGYTRIRAWVPCTASKPQAPQVKTGACGAVLTDPSGRLDRVHWAERGRVSDRDLLCNEGRV